MLDFSFGELAVIGTVALVVLGPERLPKVARTVGDWIGKAQRYVNQVKSDINREMELAELKKLQEEARNVAQSAKTAFEGVQAELRNVGSELTSAAASEPATPASDYSWEGAGESWERKTFPKRYKPGPSVDDLAEELARIKRELALPDSRIASGSKRGPRSKVNRTRIRR